MAIQNAMIKIMGNGRSYGARKARLIKLKMLEKQSLGTMARLRLQNFSKAQVG